MIIRLRAAFGGAASAEAAEAAVGRGMADLLAALDNVIDDDAALRRVWAGPAVSTARAAGQAASRRRLAPFFAGGAAAALAAGAVVAMAILLPGAGPADAKGPAVTTAYVVKRITSALSAADPGEIAQMTVTTRSTGAPGTRSVTTTGEVWSYGDRWRSVTYSAAGYPRYDEGFSTAATYTVVNYRARTWARRPGLGRPAKLAPGTRGCGPVVASLPLLLQPGLPGSGLAAGWQPATVARALHAAISCGSLAVAGRQRVDGVEALKLTSSQDSPISETIWVSPGTYLPVRVVVGPPFGMPGPWQTADISWLRPTAHNLAELTVPVPTGFRQVALAEAVRSISQRTRVWTKG
jgi:hypothetical protein